MGPGDADAGPEALLALLAVADVVGGVRRVFLAVIDFRVGHGLSPFTCEAVTVTAFPGAKGKPPQPGRSTPGKRKAEAPVGKRPWQLARPGGGFKTPPRKAAR